MLLEIINTYGAQILGTLLLTLAGILGMAVKDLAQKFLDTDTKRTLARLVVQFVEQTCRELHGEEKLSAAIGALSELLAEKKIKISETEMKVLLEAAVAEFNGAFCRN